MMNTIVNENVISFKELEKKIFSYVCELGCSMIQFMLEGYNKESMENRNKEELRDKGKRKTSIKTIMGEVAYSRNVCRTIDDEGHKAWIYPLDKAMQMLDAIQTESRKIFRRAFV